MKRKLGIILLLPAGSVSLCYGLFFHGAMIEETKQREIQVAVSTMPGIGESPSDDHCNAISEPPKETPESKAAAESDDVDPFRSPSDGEKSVGSSENPFESPPETTGLLDVKYEKVTEDYVDVHEEPESVIVREVTFGGVALLANGRLKRTYSGAPPSLCPT